MCGIAGFNFKVDKNYIYSKLYHRGPDEKGEFSDNSFSLFHTRLSIQDISNGHQPFFYKNL
jgi:asparagine synthase (glutamine-hydrolysing)